MGELAAMLGAIVLVATHMALGGVSFYKGYKQGAKDTDSEYRRLPSYQRYQKMNQDKERNGTTSS